MPLVIFFVPEPVRGVAEMARVVAPGGVVCAYAWDLPGGGFPYEVMQEALRSVGKTPLMPPNPDAAALGNLEALWRGAGLVEVQTTAITVTRTFESFDDFWATNLLGPSLAPALANMPAEQLAALRDFTRAALPPDASGRVHGKARAQAVRGRVPV
jgi:SAM-dependent methyltransferase